MITEKLKKIVKDPKLTPPTACVIWLHGLGSNGYDFAEIIPELGLPSDHQIRFIFPHAPQRAVTLNNGLVMPAWYDIFGLSAGSQEDTAGIELAYQMISELIEEQHQAGIAYDRIFLIGFSQGGALCLYTSLKFPYQLAGVAGLSSYLPLKDILSKINADQIKASLPIFLAHGLSDTVLTIKFGEKSLEYLQNLGYTVQWHTYPMAHTVCAQELTNLGQWIWKNL